MISDIGGVARLAKMTSHVGTDFYPGDIILTAAPGLLPRLIRFGTQELGEAKTLVSHAGLVVDRQGTIIEARRRVVSHHLLAAYAGKKDQVAILRPRNIPDAHLELIVDEAWKHVGEVYGYTKITLHIFDGLIGKLGIPPVFTRFAFLDDFPICSHLVGLCYAAAGYDFGIPARMAAPDHILDHGLSYPDHYKVVRQLFRIPEWPYRKT